MMTITCIELSILGLIAGLAAWGLREDMVEDAKTLILSDYKKAVTVQGHGLPESICFLCLQPKT